MLSVLAHDQNNVQYTIPYAIITLDKALKISPCIRGGGKMGENFLLAKNFSYYI